ncbi:hypothetical protein NARC_200035 [Candidatus Nitrosocosmicus arcticus]|uniref:Uncharacterized protein n=1 Tax=Candidatus Nitrosocosmicus arcticus TaxID=2035267 RepID=A0A557SRB2_9ARCH|nr:hypothetical protein NARC_200035 [Candidatus Nitrosocosmicus arcticus]
MIYFKTKTTVYIAIIMNTNGFKRITYKTPNLFIHGVKEITIIINIMNK